MKLFLTIILAMVAGATLGQFTRLARPAFRFAFWLSVLALWYSLQGCAMLPVPLQPQNEQYNSNAAEGTWLVLDAIDTAQTMHLHRDRDPQTLVMCNREADPMAAKIYGSQYPSPSRVLLTNIALAVKLFLEVFLGIVAAATLAQYIRLARWPFRLALFLALLALVLSLQGCATPPVGIWEGGMRMPDDAACTINTSGVDPVLESCT